MGPGVYFIRLGNGRNLPIKIGFSGNPLMRLRSLCNYHKKDGVLLAHTPGDGDTERRIHKELNQWSLGLELFLFDGDVKKLAEKYAVKPVRKKYEERNPSHSRRKIPPGVMNEARIKLVGDHLNGRNGRKQLTGPQIAKRLKISTASIYAFWKQAGPGKFVRKQPSDRGKVRAAKPRG